VSAELTLTGRYPGHLTVSEGSVSARPRPVKEALPFLIPNGSLCVTRVTRAFIGLDLRERGSNLMHGR
jgi:hypothetical protein